MPRLTAVILIVVSLAGCGGHNVNSTRANATKAPWSVADVKRVFRQHGITLSVAPPPIPHNESFASLSGMARGHVLDVAVYPKAGHNYVVIVGVVGSGKPHAARARNVTVSWAGVELPAVRAAINQLR